VKPGGQTLRFILPAHQAQSESPNFPKKVDSNRSAAHWEIEIQELRADLGLARDRFFVRKLGKPGLRRETAPGFHMPGPGRAPAPAAKPISADDVARLHAKPRLLIIPLLLSMDGDAALSGSGTGSP
jgi:hypothetical protein